MIFLQKSKKDLLEIFVVILFIGVYTLAASLVSLNRFWQFDAFWYDFGILDETIWKLSRFQLPIIPSLNPPVGILVWGDHFNPSAILLAPVYWISNRPETTLIAQAIVVGLSALVIYIITRKVINNSWVRFSLIFSYLGFVGMQNALYTDIHNIVFALLPLSLAFLSIYNQNWKAYWVFLIISLGFQENIAGLGVCLGLFLILKRNRNMRVGIMTILISGLYALLATKVLMPFFGNHGYSYHPTYPQEITGWVTQFFDPIGVKTRTLFFTFLSFGIMPLFSLSTLPLIIEHYLERFVLNTVGTRWDLGFHYNSLTSLIMVIGSIDLIMFLQTKKIFQKILTFWAMGTIVLVIFFHRFILHGPLLLATHPVFYEQTQRAKFYDNFIAAIPKNRGLIMAQNNIAAHLTHYNVTLLRQEYPQIKPDWIVFDTREGQNLNNFHPAGNIKILASRLASDSAYVKYYSSGGQMIYQRK